jgi:hypothetical protein
LDIVCINTDAPVCPGSPDEKYEKKIARVRKYFIILGYLKKVKPEDRLYLT